jgi:hypothetical protein
LLFSVNMNRVKMQIIRFAANLKMPSNVYKRAQYEATLDDIYVKLIVVPLQKAFREKYPPYDPKRPFCPNPRECHFEFAKTPYLRDGYCPLCDDTCFCLYCGKLMVGTADWELSFAANRHLCSDCRREEDMDDYKISRSTRG